MPILFNQPIKQLSEQEFHNLDFQMMRFAFNTHNRLGRFYDEKIYQNELISLCAEAGLEIATQVMIKLTHHSFCKHLFIDLLIENGGIYELKASNAIVASHRVQVLGYLFLAGIQHGKIINFRPPSVEHEFVSTSLTHAERRSFSVNEDNWDDKTESAQWLKSVFIDRKFLYFICEKWPSRLSNALATFSSAHHAKKPVLDKYQ